MTDRKTSQALDIHREGAARIFGVRPEDVTPEQRRFAKIKLHAEVYGRRPTTPVPQQFPLRTPEGTRLREAFAPSGASFGDYSQIEQRILARCAERKPNVR